MENHNKHEYWNCKPPKPVICTLEVFPTQEQCETLKVARATLAAAMQCLSEEQQLASEYSVMSKLLYMRHGQLRREKSFQGLKQIWSCLKKFFTYGLGKEIRDFHSDFHDAILQEGIRVYLPSRQMWEYLLTHLLGAAALLTNTASRCAGVFLHVHKHLTTGNLIPINMVFLSMLSRIWACCHALCLDIQTWYQGLIPVKDILASTNFAWLPEGESMPENLSSWISEQSLDDGLATFDRVAANDDMAVLMEMCQQGKESEDEDEGTDALDETLPISMDDTLPAPGENSAACDEDFGDPVRTSDVDADSEVEGKENGDADIPEQSRKGSASTVVPGLKVKVRQAPTIRDLQFILKKFCKKFPEYSTRTRQRKCATLLNQYESKAQIAEGKGRLEQAQKFLNLGRNKLQKFIKLSSPHSKELDVGQSPDTALVSSKKKKKKLKSVVPHENEDQIVTAPDTKTKRTKTKNTKNFASAVSQSSLAATKKKKRKTKSNQDVQKIAGGSSEKKKKQLVRSADNSLNPGAAAKGGNKNPKDTKSREAILTVTAGGIKKKKKTSLSYSLDCADSGATPVGIRKHNTALVWNMDKPVTENIRKKKKRKLVTDSNRNDDNSAPLKKKKKGNKKSVKNLATAGVPKRKGKQRKRKQQRDS